MRYPGTFFAASLLLLLAPLAPAQGGQGGGGQGGGGLGGGFGGGGGAFQGGQDGGDGQNGVPRQLFLSPGDRTEWEYEAKADEAIVVSVTSDVFDPAVAIVDEAGKKVAENDDIAPGNQMARVLYVAPRAGKYKAVVTNYKGTAGGPFTFTTRRFATFALKMNELSAPQPNESRAWARIDIERPGEYVAALRFRDNAGIQMMDPTGADLNPNMTEYAPGYTQARFVAKTPGPYLFAFESPAIQFRITPLAESTTTVGATVPQTLAEDQIQRWTIAAKKDDLVEIAFPSTDARVFFQFENDRPGLADASQSPYRVLLTTLNPPRAYVAMLQDGPIRLTVRQTLGLRASYEIRPRPAGRPWPAGSELAGKLDWYGADIWTLDGKSGDILKLQASADTYMLDARVMNPAGDIQVAGTTGVPPTTSATVEMNLPGRYVVLVSGSGTGAYRLRREVTEPRRLTTDVSRGEIKGAPEVWRFRAEKGQDVALLVKSSSLRWRITVTTPDGKPFNQLVHSQSPNDDLLRLRIPTTGDYTLTVASLDGSTGAYQLKWIDLAK